MTTKHDDYNRFLATNAGKRLLDNHSLNDEGLWQVFGEDPKCGLHGSNHQPSLGFFQGKLGDIIMYAVKLQKFWQWGAGGDFEKITPVAIDHTTVEELARLYETRQQLTTQLEQLNQRLEWLGGSK